MKFIRTANELGHGSRKVCLAIGVFDGVHLGHQQIIRQAVADARQHDAVALVVTFDRHPNAIVAPDRVPPQIFSHSQKLRAIEALGADALLEIHFDRSFSEKTGEEFMRELVRDLGRVCHVCVGANFLFGQGRSGNVALLQKLGLEAGFQVHGHGAVALDGQLVSSTRIREAIRSGRLDDASQMLGRAYAICGQVMAGDQIGRQLGFPTANLNTTNLVLPPNGVYAGCTLVAGKYHQAALNLGLRPTVASATPQLRAEAHVLDFDGDLYGMDLEVEIGEKLREERKFSSPDDLRLQIARDIAAVRSAA